MKNGLKAYLYVLSAVCLIFSGAILDVYAQETTSISTRQQRIQMANEHYAKGKELNRQGNYAAANEEFKKAQDILAGKEVVETAPEAAEALPQKPAGRQQAAQEPAAVVAEPQKESKKAAKAKKKESIKAPVIPAEVQKDADNYFRMGLESSAKGQSEKAIAAYQEAVRLTPNNPNLYYNMGIECLRLSRFTEAAALFKTVIEINPKDKDAYYNLGVIYDSYLGDKPLAKTYYKQYLKYGNKSDDVREVRSWITQIDKEMKELQ
ncbi:MAG: tetratricopeptide repeat protein [Candidatus Omnitrophota bacterium]